MPDSYNVGTDPGQISLQVTLGSAATCHTTVIQKTQAGVKTTLADSIAGSNGSLPSTPIGPAASLNGSEIIIQTLAQLGALPAAVIADVVTDLSSLLNYVDITYSVNGGTNGLQTYSYDVTDCVASTDGTVAVITKSINAIP